MVQVKCYGAILDVSPASLPIPSTNLVCQHRPACLAYAGSRLIRRDFDSAD